MPPRRTLNRRDFRWLSPGYPIPQEDRVHFHSPCSGKSRNAASFSILTESISEAIAWYRSWRFSERTFIRMMTRIIRIVIASGLPTSERKSEVWDCPLITMDWIDRREQKRSMKRSVWPQYLVEPQYIEGYFEGSRTASVQ